MANISKLLPASGFLIATVLVMATSAFKEVPKQRDDTYTFEYNPPTENDYSAASVHNVANWQYTDDPSPCLGSDKTCSLEVPGGLGFVDNPATSPALDSSINIQATENESGVAKVSSTAADEDGAVISNQSE